MDIDLRHLRHARTLAEHGHFGRAASALGLSQPALSRSIAELERRVGTRLFDRSPGRVEPTDMGSLLLERAGDLLDRSKDLGREIESLRGRGAGTLRIGAGTYPADMLVGDAVAALLTRRPDVQVQVTVDNVLNLLPPLRRRELDVVIGDVTEFADDPEFHVTPLAARQGYFACRTGHPLLRKSSVTLRNIMTFPLVVTSRLTPRLLGPIVAASRQPGGTSNSRSAPAVTCESLAMMRSIIAGSDAIAILPLSAINPAGETGDLAVLPLVEPWLRARFAIVRLARRTPPPSSELLTQLLLEADAEITRLITEAQATLSAGGGQLDP